MADFRRVLLNSGWNLLGNLVPLLAAAFAVPFLLHTVGVERFGLLSLVWVLIGYFSLLDLGLSRALTKMIAERDDGQHAAELSSLCSTGTALVTALGVAGGLLVALGAACAGPWLARLPEALRTEAQLSLLWVALGIPVVVGTAALRGVLEGFQRFKTLTALRTPAGVALFLTPCATALLSPRLDLAVAVMLATRLVFLVLHLLPCRELVRFDFHHVNRSWLRPLVVFGGWLTLTNVVAPVIVYLDRFVIGALMPAASVAHYAAPFEVVSRLLLLPMALSGALFPALSKAQAQDPQASHRLLHSSLKLLLVLVFPLVGLGMLVAGPLLSLWLGADFASHGTRVMQILLVGFAFNALAQLPFAALASAGLTRQTALLQVTELVLYLGLLTSLVRSHGLEGAAVAWSIRACLDFFALSALVRLAERKHLCLAATTSDDLN